MKIEHQLYIYIIVFNRIYTLYSIQNHERKVHPLAPVLEFCISGIYCSQSTTTITYSVEFHKWSMGRIKCTQTLLLSHKNRKIVFIYYLQSRFNFHFELF